MIALNNGYTLPVRQSFQMLNYGAMYCPAGGAGMDTAMLAGALATPTAWGGTTVRSVPPMYNRFANLFPGIIGQRTPKAQVNPL